MGESEHLLDQVARKGLFTDGLFSQCQPELTGLQGHVLIWVLRPLEHILGKKKPQQQVIKKMRKRQPNIV